MIEAALVVTLLAIAAPPSLRFAQGLAAARGDAALVERASMLGVSVLEAVMADVASRSETLGPAALDDPLVYVDDPATGLRVRLRDVTEAHERMGLRYTVEVGPRAAADGSVTGDAQLDRYRAVTVRVTAPLSTGVVETPFATLIDAGVGVGP